VTYDCGTLTWSILKIERNVRRPARTLHLVADEHRIQVVRAAGRIIPGEGMYQNDSGGVAFFFNCPPEFDHVREWLVSPQFDFDVDGPASQIPAYIHGFTPGANPSTATPTTCWKNLLQLLAKNSGKFICE
jgi:hypothetical protein